MQSKIHAAAACLLLVLAGPAVAWQGWDSIGEPNTDLDRSGRFMFTKPDGTASDQKVYFDAILIESPLLLNGGVNPNFPGSRLMPVSNFQNLAILGFWVDCNNDGFIGSALTGTEAYSVTLVTYGDRCPEGTPYNDGFQVDEFRAIYGYEINPERGDPREADFDLVSDGDRLNPATETYDPNDVFDPGARVWGDWSTPDLPAVPSQGIIPLPPNTLTTYTGHFKYVDHATVGALSDAVGADTYYGVPRTLDRSADVYDGTNEGASPLAYARYAWNSSTTETGGSENCGRTDDCTGAYAQPFIMLFDCTRSDGTTVDVPAEAEPYTGGDIYTAPVAPGNVNANGSIDGTTRQNTRAVWTSEPGECDRGGVSGLLYDNLESTSQDSSLHAEKVHTDFAYRFAPEWHIRFNGDTGLPDTVAWPNEGVCRHATHPCIWSGGGYWYDNTGWSRRPPRAFWGITEIIRVTNYADLTDAAFTEAGAIASAALPTAGPDGGAYGSEQCSSFAPGVTSSTGTWNCDPAAWNEDDSRTYLAAVGDPYDLRDEDCYDGSAQPGFPLFPTGGC